MDCDGDCLCTRHPLNAYRLDEDTLAAASAGQPGDDPVAALLVDAAQGVGWVATAVPGEAPALQAFRTARQRGEKLASQRGEKLHRAVRPARRRRSGVVIAATATALLVGAGSAAAASGGLSVPVREMAQKVLATVGLDASSGREGPDDAPEAGTPSAAPSPKGSHGAEVTKVAQGSELQGKEKGDAVSDVASQGRSDARGTAKESTGRPADTHGGEVSDVAKTTPPSGRDKGASVSGVASSRAPSAPGAGGDQGKGSQPAGG